MAAGRGIPLVRAASLVPFIKHLERRGAPVDRHLSASNLSYYPYEKPEHPIALLGGLTFLNRIAWTEGAPDIGCLVVAGDSIKDLGILGQAVLNAGTVREALQRAGAILRHFCSHEHLQLRQSGSEAAITVAFARSIDPGALYIAEQYTAMLLQRVCEASGFHGPVFRSIAFRGQPIGSLDLMRHWFGDEVVRNREPYMRIVLSPGVLDRPFAHHREALPTSQMASWLPLGPGLSVESAVGYLVEAMLFDSVPSIGDVARVAGMTIRTLQRRLNEEGTSYSDLLDNLRRKRALADLLESRTTIGALSSSLGYSSQNSFTRAFRRWTDESPRGYRRYGSSER